MNLSGHRWWLPGGRRAGARIARGRQANGGWTAQLMAAGGTLAEPGFERGGAHQAAGEAAEDHAEIAGLEPIDERPGQWLGGVLTNRGGEQGAIGDEPADDADDTADAAGFGGGGGGLIGMGDGRRGRGPGASVGPTGIGLEDRDDGSGEGGRHEGIKAYSTFDVKDYFHGEDDSRQSRANRRLAWHFCGEAGGGSNPQ